MKNSLILSIISLSLLFLSCTGTTKLSDTEKINNNVRDFFFLADSITIESTITDTLKADELEELIAQVEKNINFINQDLDTLSIMIDDRAYKKLNYEKLNEELTFFKKKKYADSIKNTENEILELRLKQAVLDNKRISFTQTKRILLHLRRSVWANIAGFDVSVSYTNKEELVRLDLLLDANFNIID